MQPPKPHIVRQRWKHFKALTAAYQYRMENNSFNPSSRGSRTYYERAIAKYLIYFNRWGYLLNVRLSNSGKPINEPAAQAGQRGMDEEHIAGITDME